MKTFLRVLLVAVLALVAFKLAPVLMVPVIIGGIAVLAIAGVLFGGVAALAGVGIGLLTVLLVAALAIVAALSPIWLPVLAIVGAIALIKRLNRKPVAAAKAWGIRLADGRRRGLLAR